MSEIAVENVNVAAIMSHENAAESVEKIKAAIEADPEVSALMKAADTIEDVYEIVKKFSTATFEQVKVLFQKTLDYFRDSKAILEDEVLDNVSGGWSFSQWWKEAKAVIVSTAIMVTCVTVGVVVGACVGGVGGAMAGAAIGVMAGAVIAAPTGAIMEANQKKK